MTLLIWAVIALCLSQSAMLRCDVIDEDIILLWADAKNVITGSDILGRLLRGIVQNQAIPLEKPDYREKARDCKHRLKALKPDPNRYEHDRWMPNGSELQITSLSQ